jgi:excisionase family DNA binding protein
LYSNIANNCKLLYPLDKLNEEVIPMASQHNHLYDVPSEQESELAAAGGRMLAACIGSGERAKLRMIVAGQDITVPVQAVQMLADILKQMALGHAISIIPIHAELTTQQAADFLNVSRPYLIKNILDAGKLAYHMSGNRRKVLFKNLMEYKTKQKAESREAMAQLAKLSQEMGLMD